MVQMVAVLKGGGSEQNEESWKEGLKSKSGWKSNMTRSRNNALDELSTSQDQAEKRSNYYKKYNEVIEKFPELIELGR